MVSGSLENKTVDNDAEDRGMDFEVSERSSESPFKDLLGPFKVLNQESMVSGKVELKNHQQPMRRSCQ